MSYHLNGIGQEEPPPADATLPPPTPEDVRSAEEMKGNLRLGAMMLPVVILGCVGGLYLLVRNE